MEIHSLWTTLGLSGNRPGHPGRPCLWPPSFPTGKRKSSKPRSRTVRAKCQDQPEPRPNWEFLDRPLTGKSEDWESTGIGSKLHSLFSPGHAQAPALIAACPPLSPFDPQIDTSPTSTGSLRTQCDPSAGVSTPAA